MRQKRMQLGAALAAMQRIYLDQRFWILFRDVSLGFCKDQAIADLLVFLKLSVSEGRSICPISESVFMELLKQDDDLTRLATAQLIDELSLGVTLIPFDERVRQELCNSFYQLGGARDIYPVHQLVWTKLAYVLGEVHPTKTPFPPKEELAIQKAFSDLMWRIPLVEMIEKIGMPPPIENNWDSVVDDMNEKSRTLHSTLRSYEHAFKIEFEGTLSLFRKEINTLQIEIVKRGYKDFGVGQKHLSMKKRFEAFALSIPTLHINASCHAAVRWDQKRNLSSNDFFDFHHAAAALGYCNVFLTEKPLSVLLGQRHLGLTKYKCPTFWSPSEALNWLRDNSGRTAV